MFESAVFDDLRSGIRGQVIEPGHPEYESARRVYNGMIDRRPRAVIRCAAVSDVVACVKLARRTDRLLAIRGGGHNGAGFGTCSDGLVADLSPMRGIEVDHGARTVRVEGGCTQGEVDSVTHPFGLAVPAGVVSTTGIAGLTLGGGHGYLSRRYGLTVDSLLEAEVVLADGTVVTASQDENPDLFWALRGGGGNFGVVTSFLYRAHPVGTVIAGPMLWPMEALDQVMRWYREFLPAAPEELYGFLTVMVVPPAPPFPEELHHEPVCGVVWCYAGDAADAERLLRPVRATLPPVFEHVGPMPFPALQSMFDPLLPPGLQWYWKGDFVDELSDQAIRVHQHFAAAIPTPLSLMHLYPVDGAVHRVGPHDTAFSYRRSTWSMVIAGVDPDPANAARITSWAKQYWEGLHPLSAGGAYVNFMMDEGEYRVEKTYRGNYQRLAAVKRTFDPSNLFRVNQNVDPSRA